MRLTSSANVPPTCLPCLALAASLAAAPAPSPPAAPWQALEPGLDLARLEGPPGGSGDGVVTVVRIDPARFELRLLNASAPGQGAAHSARDWAARAGAAVVVNAAMYQEDLRTSVSLMRARGHVNQRRVSKDRAVLAFDPLAGDLPPVRIIDRDCEDLDALGPRYGTLVQSIRLVSCERKNVWVPAERRTSAAIVGLDGAGRVLFVHARTAWPISTLADALIAAPIDLRRAMYVEGGPEAQLFVDAGGRELELVGAFERVPRVAQNGEGWPIPNVLAAVRRPPRPPAPAAAPAPPRPPPEKRPAPR
jgi:hypothetical protein